MKNPFNFLNKTKQKNSSPSYSLYKQNDIFEFLTGSLKTLLPNTAVGYFKDSLYVNKGFEKRAEKVGEIEFILKDLRGKVITDNEYLDLLRRPNKNMTGSQFWRLATIYRDVTGMALMLKKNNGEIWSENKKIEELELLNPLYVEIIEDTTTGLIKSFKYTHPVTKKVYNYEYDQCIYWHIPDPSNNNKPMPLLLAGLLTIQSALENEKQYNSVLKNGGTIDGLFRFKEGLNKEQIEQIKTDYARLLRDNKDGNVPLILGGDASYERVALSPRELEALESKKQLLDDMIVITGVPKAILGIASGDTYANAETAYRIFLRETIRPILKELTDVLNWKLVDDKYELDFVDPTPENIDEKIKILEVGSRVEALTLNEKREMLNLPPVADGDEIDKRPDYPMLNSVEKKNLKFNHPLRDENNRDIYYKSFLKSIEKNKKRFNKELLNYFKGQKKRVLEALSGIKDFNYKTKADFSFDLLNEPLELVYMTPLLNTMKEIKIEEGEKVAEMYDSEFAFNSSVEKTLDKRFNFFAEKINKTTAKILESEFSDWFNNNETVADLTRRVNEVYAFTSDNKWRAETIVNTEVSAITNLAKGESYKQLEIPIKIWVHRAGIKGGVRDDHASMDGEEVKFNQRFSNGMLHPHDPSADGGDVINCMCTF